MKKYQESENLRADVAHVSYVFRTNIFRLQKPHQTLLARSAIKYYIKTLYKMIKI